LLATIIPDLAVTVRRLHDTDSSRLLDFTGFDPAHRHGRLDRLVVRAGLETTGSAPIRFSPR